MTLLVGIRCTDGAVIGTDSAMTFGPSPQHPTIEQRYEEKITIVDNRIIVAGTGPIGLGQRFADNISKRWENKELQGKSAIDVGRQISAVAVNDFASTKVSGGTFGALVAFPVGKTAELFEFGVTDLQPEVKSGANWYASMGSGQAVADPLLGFVRVAFWGIAPRINKTVYLLQPWY